MTDKSNQLDAWTGEFGDAYADRNVADPDQITPLLKECLLDIHLGKILEVGCNRGHNLVAVSKLFPEQLVVGVEPNSHARTIARKWDADICVLPGNAFDLPFKDGYFDLVFTAGVLIHIALADLPRAMREICRVSRKYVLALEYYAEKETMIPYRGHANLLWKRNFLAHYQAVEPSLKVVRNGYFTEIFEKEHWWLMEKTVSQVRSDK